MNNGNKSLESGRWNDLEGNDSIKISIITATCNSATPLPATIASVLSQQGVELEYLIIDGASADDTLEVIKQAAAKDARIRWISEPDEGIADAFNKGVAMATGDWIGILGSDDQYLPGTLLAVAEAVRKNPDTTVIHGDLVRLDEKGKPLFVVKPSAVAKTLWHQMPINHPAAFVARKAFDEIGCFDKSLKIAMDYDLILRLYKAGGKFVYVSKPLTMMSYGGASDERCLDGLRELRQIKIREGYPAWKANYWLAHRVLIEWVKKLLRRTKLHFLLKLHPRFRKV